MGLERILSKLVIGTALVISSNILQYQPLVYSQEQNSGSSEEKNYDGIVKELLFSVSQKAVGDIGIQGGYGLTKPENGIEIKSKQIYLPFYYDRGKRLMPDVKSIEKEITDYIDSVFFEELESQGKLKYNKALSKIKTTATIKEKHIEFFYDVSLGILQDNGQIKTLNMKPATSVGSRLYYMLQIAKYITDSDVGDPHKIKINLLYKFLKERNLGIFSGYFKGIPNCTFYRISRHIPGDSYIRIPEFRDKPDDKEKLVKEIDNSGEPENFQFMNRYEFIKKPENKVPLPPAPAPQPSSQKIPKESK